MTEGPYYKPEFEVAIDGSPLPGELRGAISAMTFQNGLEGADRVELTIADEGLRLLDHPLLAMDRKLALSIGYAPRQLQQIFVGEVVSQSATFPAGGIPTITVAAQDLRHRLQRGSKTRWFAVKRSNDTFGPLNDPAIIAEVTGENMLIPIENPISAALSVFLGIGEMQMAGNDPLVVEKLIRHQIGESDYDFLKRIAKENGWEMLMDHTGALGGRKLRFMSPLENLEADVTLAYGQSLIDFTPHLTTVGDIFEVVGKVWLSSRKAELTISASWDWDRQSLSVSVTPSFGVGSDATGTPEAAEAAKKRKPPAQDYDSGEKGDKGNKPQLLLLEQPLTLMNAARVILGKLLPQINNRLTGKGSTIGNPAIGAGKVLRLEGVGKKFSGLYRVVSATHTIDTGGYRTSFDVRKEAWFGSIPEPQGTAM